MRGFGGAAAAESSAHGGAGTLTLAKVASCNPFHPVKHFNECRYTRVVLQPDFEMGILQFNECILLFSDMPAVDIDNVVSTSMEVRWKKHW